MSLSLLSGCLVVLVILVVAVLGRVTSSGKKKNSATARSGKASGSWILYIAIALILAIWTIWATFFFFAVVWLLRQDPKPYSKEISLPTNTVKKTARLLYIWLMLSSIFAVPTFVLLLFNLSSDSSTNERVLAALIPLVFYLPLLLGLTSESTFVFRHTQQALFLMAMRTGVALLTVGLANEPFDGIWVFLLGNGALWLFGSLWGWDQIKRGECWFMERKGQKVVSAEATTIDSAPMDQELKSMLKTLDAKEALAAKNKALQAFRTGSPESKKRAVEILYTLGEVEKF